MPCRGNFIWIFLLLFVGSGLVSAGINSNGSLLGIEFPHHPSFGPAIDDECRGSTSSYQSSGEGTDKPPLKLSLKHKPTHLGSDQSKKEAVKLSAHKDLARIHTLHRRITEQRSPPVSGVAAPPAAAEGGVYATQLVATLESGVTLGSGEYFIDVFVGTPPRHFSLILDTGSDLNWLQCLPCHDCFDQQGPPYDPKASASFKNITCRDPRCRLASPPDPSLPCKSDSQTCEYFYWYGDQSNTTGDFALETFTVNLTSATGGPEFRRVENVMFGCGHWNRGLFHGAAGLLGLGRGPLSFSSQLRAVYGHTFSYCLVDRNSNLSVSSKLIFGEDPGLMTHPRLNFTTLTNGKENPIDTFYYLQIQGVKVGGEPVDIPAETWEISPEGAGGTIIDSGTTLSYFTEPAYKKIKEAFQRKVKKYPVVDAFPILNPCYNVSGTGKEKVELPEFSILFADGAVWDFPQENYFIWLDPDEIVCLAILGTPRSSLSILGNYQQQNFHVLYDTEKSRLGFAPMQCADV